MPSSSSKSTPAPPSWLVPVVGVRRLLQGPLSHPPNGAVSDHAQYVDAPSRCDHRAWPGDPAWLRRGGELAAPDRRRKRRPAHRRVRRQRLELSGRLLHSRGSLADGKFNPDDWMEPKEQRKVDDFIVF